MHKDFGYYLRPSVHNSSTYTDENSMIKVPERMNHSMQILQEKKDYENINQSTFIKRQDMFIRVDLSKRNLKVNDKIHLLTHIFERKFLIYS